MYVAMALRYTLRVAFEGGRLIRPLSCPFINAIGRKGAQSTAVLPSLDLCLCATYQVVIPIRFIYVSISFLIISLYCVGIGRGRLSVVMPPYMPTYCVRALCKWNLNCKRGELGTMLTIPRRGRRVFEACPKKCNWGGLGEGQIY